MREFEEKSEFEKELDRIICNGVTTYDEKFYLFHNLVGYFKDWQPPKELVEVPQFVADWFEDSMEGTLAGVISSYAFNDIEAVKWVQGNGGIDLLCRMELDGYTVEKEELYEVIINGLYLAKLMKDDDSKSHRFIEKDKLVNWQETGYRLTAKQIKMIDPRYWAFRKEVEI